jgi:hypothetical protein
MRKKEREITDRRELETVQKRSESSIWGSTSRAAGSHVGRRAERGPVLVYIEREGHRYKIEIEEMTGKKYRV